MVRPLVKEYLDMDNDKNVDSVMYYTFYGLSTDTKPTNATITPLIVTGSMFIEIDSGKVYFYDEDSSEWLEFGGSNS